MSAPDLDALATTLERRFRTVTEPVQVGAYTIEITHPASAEELIDEEAFALDERLPYWADVWPSARVLAARVLQERGTRRTLLELGCGAGLVATCAALAGFRVTATDYYDDALRFARVNAWRNSGVRIEARHLDWRHLPPDLGRFDVVVASDVLYESHYAALVADAIARTLAPRGIALVTDPGRLALGDFVARLRERGLDPGSPERVPYEDGAIRQSIQLYELSWRAGSSRGRTEVDGPEGE